MNDIQFETILYAQSEACPKEVLKEAERFWEDMGFGADCHYVPFFPSDQEENYPVICEYLNSRGVERCLIYLYS